MCIRDQDVTDCNASLEGVDKRVDEPPSSCAFRLRVKVNARFEKLRARAATRTAAFEVHSAPNVKDGSIRVRGIPRRGKERVMTAESVGIRFGGLRALEWV